MEDDNEWRIFEGDRDAPMPLTEPVEASEMFERKFAIRLTENCTPQRTAGDPEAEGGRSHQRHGGGSGRPFYGARGRGGSWWRKGWRKGRYRYYPSNAWDGKGISGGECKTACYTPSDHQSGKGWRAPKEHWGGVTFEVLKIQNIRSVQPEKRHNYAVNRWTRCQV